VLSDAKAADVMDKSKAVVNAIPSHFFFIIFTSRQGLP